MKQPKNYGAADIVTLSPGNAYQTKLGMYLSADKQEAINLGLRELIYNAQDEYEATFKKGARVTVEVSRDKKTISVEDNMRGLPVGLREDGTNSLTAAFLIPHSGAKHNEGVYLNAVGVNGQGLKIVCHTSKWLKVTVWQDKKIFTQSFHETDEGAIPDGPVETVAGSSKTGTKITYYPSDIIYEGETINLESLRTSLRELSYFTKGLELVLVYDEEEEKFISRNGLADGLNREERVHSNIFYFQKNYDDCSVELALQWGKTAGEIKPYANNLFVRDGGDFMTGFKMSLTKAFNHLAKKDFSGEQIRRTLSGYVSVKVREVKYSNQAKTALANKEARTAASNATSEGLKEFQKRYPKDFQTILDLMDREQKAEAAAQRARDAIVNSSKEIGELRRKKVFIPDKLKDAEKLGQESVLCIVEGENFALICFTTYQWGRS